MMEAKVKHALSKVHEEGLSVLFPVYRQCQHTSNKEIKKHLGMNRCEHMGDSYPYCEDG